jgi:stress-induced morphogen
MPVQVAELEQAIRDAFPVSHLHIEDQSSGCGESYSVLLVSEVRTRSVPYRSSSEESP